MFYKPDFLSSVKRLRRLVDRFLLRNLPLCYHIVTALRGTVDNVLICSVNDLTPLTWDEEVRVQLQVAVKLVMLQLLENEGCRQVISEKRFECFVKYLRSLSPPVREAIYLKFSSCLLSYLHMRKLKRYEYDTIVQVYFHSLKSV